MPQRQCLCLPWATQHRHQIQVRKYKYLKTLPTVRAQAGTQGLSGGPHLTFAAPPPDNWNISDSPKVPICFLPLSKPQEVSVFSLKCSSPVSPKFSLILTWWSNWKSLPPLLISQLLQENRSPPTSKYFFYKPCNSLLKWLLCLSPDKSSPFPTMHTHAHTATQTEGYWRCSSIHSAWAIIVTCWRKEGRNKWMKGWRRKGRGRVGIMKGIEGERASI